MDDCKVAPESGRCSQLTAMDTSGNDDETFFEKTVIDLEELIGDEEEFEEFIKMMSAAPFKRRAVDVDCNTVPVIDISSDDDDRLLSEERDSFISVTGVTDSSNEMTDSLISVTDCSNSETISSVGSLCTEEYSSVKEMDGFRDNMHTLDSEGIRLQGGCSNQISDISTPTFRSPERVLSYSDVQNFISPAHVRATLSDLKKFGVENVLASFLDLDENENLVSNPVSKELTIHHLFSSHISKTECAESKNASAELNVINESSFTLSDNKLSESTDVESSLRGPVHHNAEDEPVNLPEKGNDQIAEDGYLAGSDSVRSASPNTEELLLEEKFQEEKKIVTNELSLLLPRKENLMSEVAACFSPPQLEVKPPMEEIAQLEVKPPIEEIAQRVLKYSLEYSVAAGGRCSKDHPEAASTAVVLPTAPQHPIAAPQHPIAAGEKCNAENFPHASEATSVAFVLPSLPQRSVAAEENFHDSSKAETTAFPLPSAPVHSAVAGESCPGDNFPGPLETESTAAPLPSPPPLLSDSVKSEAASQRNVFVFGKEISHEFQAPIVAASSSENSLNPPENASPQELPPWAVPWISTDEAENADNNDPGWDLLRNLKTDEERYRVVRRQWQQEEIPNPRRDLTHINYRGALRQDVASQSRKRRLSIDIPDSVEHPNKRRKILCMCTDMFDDQINGIRGKFESSIQALKSDRKKAIRELASRQEQEQQEMFYATGPPMRLERKWNDMTQRHQFEYENLVKKFQRKQEDIILERRGAVRLLEQASKEVLAFNKFYNDLEKSSDNFCLISEEDYHQFFETEEMYELFDDFYAG